ncbi:MAG TPA: cysteine--1-D-myo-inosityl 2-amino-2-deoxy-alpha-D-glucopyranoside ligase [Streptosporangiaceae bacterium]|jgi:L-cysteine:1D-myo-inositol 2-amino-2-deoxy-alpha-D-glucopyranoside ligase|nr:cysteine--1-D-myo-inosityl 2-amino-2-deoxy-alpha-D-glucopyranoside ligase [Streptosporangiaceae bacterium]
MDSWRGVSIPDLPGHGPEPLVFDTSSGELAVAAAGPDATLYACGITPYDATHIGHAATFMAWDLLVRAWRDAGHHVTYVQNVTDVDDPLLERAARDGEDWRELADREIDRYRADMAALRVLPPTRLVGAVEALGVIERFAGRLAQRGALYDLEADQYFARGSDEAFGSVSRLDRGEMLALFAERGGDPGRPGKKDPLDALVWLAARPNEPAWASRFGQGRPGWHVECAAISTEYLGTTFDIQAGGTDLIFPHHEMSASHARVALEPGAFARHYVHAGMVRLDGEKMSKSLGNLVFVSRLLADGHDPMAVRLAILAHHYRRDWDWTDAGLSAAADRLARWRDAVQVAAAADSSSPPSDPERGQAVLAAMRERLADDLDAPGALAVVDGWAEDVLAGARPAADSGADLVRDAVDALLGVVL